MLVPVELPIKEDKLILKVYDQDPVSDELVCSVHISMKSILKCDISKPMGTSMKKWINLYGGPTGYSGPNFDRMNHNPKQATSWKGRIFVEYFCEDVKYPVFKIQEIKDMSAYSTKLTEKKDY